MKRLLKYLYNKYIDYKTLINRIVFIKRYHKVSLFNRLKMYFHGFKSDDYVMYDLKNNNIKNYLNELDRWHARNINGKYNVIFDDKNVFYDLFKDYVDIPKNLFIIKDNNFISYDGELLNIDDVYTLIYKYKMMILKPIDGCGGHNVYLLEVIDQKMYINKCEYSKEKIVKFLLSLNDYLVAQFANQHVYAQNLYPNASNTIRIITYQDPLTKTPEIAYAIQRIGNDVSAPVDNLCSGSICAMINLDTGMLTKARSYRLAGEFAKHPDTSALIEGVVVPNWKKIKKEILNVSKKFPYLKFIAWDVLIKDDGFWVIEINASTDFEMIQLFEGLKTSKLAEFYKYHKILKK